MQPRAQILINTIKNVSTNNAKQRTVEALNIETKDNYYQKIGTKAIQNESDSKPEGWDAARPFKDIPGPKALPVIGNLWRFLPVIGNFYNVPLVDLYERLRREYGDIIYFGKIPGQRPMVFIYNPDDIEKVLRNEGPWPIRLGLPSFVYYRKHVRNDVFQGVGGVLSEQGEAWFKFRSVVNKILMQPRTAQMYVKSMDEVAKDLIKNMRYFSQTHPNQEMPSDFQNELHKWTLESIAVIAYNKRIGCLSRTTDKDSEGQKLIDSAVELFDLMYKLDVLPSAWRYISTPNWRRYVKILDFITEINQKYIDDCLSNVDPDDSLPDHRRSVLERLAKVDRKIAVAMATDMLIAGIDTTGRTMAAALYYLAKNPDKQEKLRNELKEHLPRKDSPITKEMLLDTPYLKATIKETTRIAPISIGNLRTNIKDLVLAGYQLPKGSDVLAIHLAISLDEKYYKDSKSFIPERWLRTTTDEISYKNVHPFVSLPFGFGPRSCIGKRLANLELEVGLSKVIRNFKLSWPHEDAKFDTKLLYGIADPLKLKVEELDC